MDGCLLYNYGREPNPDRKLHKNNLEENLASMENLEKTPQSCIRICFAIIENEFT